MATAPSWPEALLIPLDSVSHTLLSLRPAAVAGVGALAVGSDGEWVCGPLSESAWCGAFYREHARDFCSDTSWSWGAAQLCVLGIRSSGEDPLCWPHVFELACEGLTPHRGAERDWKPGFPPAPAPTPSAPATSVFSFHFFESHLEAAP